MKTMLLESIIAVIDRHKLKEYEIKEYIVKDILHKSEVLHPEDDEVILVHNGTGNIPSEVIIEILKIT